MQAVESGDGDRLSELYRDGLDINAISVASKSPLLHHAACSGQVGYFSMMMLSTRGNNRVGGGGGGHVREVSTRSFPNNIDTCMYALYMNRRQRKKSIDARSPDAVFHEEQLYRLHHPE